MFGIFMFDTQLLESEAHKDAFTLPAPFSLPTVQDVGRKQAALHLSDQLVIQTHLDQMTNILPGWKRSLG